MSERTQIPYRNVINTLFYIVLFQIMRFLPMWNISESVGEIT